MTLSVHCNTILYQKASDLFLVYFSLLFSVEKHCKKKTDRTFLYCLLFSHTVEQASSTHKTSSVVLFYFHSESVIQLQRNHSLLKQTSISVLLVNIQSRLVTIIRVFWVKRAHTKSVNTYYHCNCSGWKNVVNKSIQNKPWNCVLFEE